MKVYRLNVEAYRTCYGELQEKYSTYSDVYSTLKRAVDEGKEWLEHRIKTLYENSSYCTKEDSLTLKEMFDDEEIYYNFRVTEVDPVYSDSFYEILSEKECVLNRKPTHIVYVYNYEGNLKYKQFQWTNGGEHRSGQIILRFPGDEEKDAGEKFNIGDFVTIKDKIYVIYGKPYKENGKLTGENKYYLSTIEDDRLWAYEEAYEYELRKYEGTIEENSPYNFLRKMYTNEIKVDEKYIEKLENGEIVLNENPSFRDLIKWFEVKN